MKKVFKQQRGSAIGNQISPSLAQIADSYLEHQWQQQHKDALEKHSDELYIVRYVENRPVLCGQHLAERWFMQEFLTDFFYRHPVELEDVTNGDFLGTILYANLRTLSFQQPIASFQFRPFRSAGTENRSFQLMLPEYACPADIPSHINKPDLMYSNWRSHTWSTTTQPRSCNS